jgi:AcrR family transcriptional regulator
MVSAAKHITQRGYAETVLDLVAADAGYTRGALYHLFANKEELVLAVVEWVREAWNEKAGFLLADETDPVDTLVAVARAYAVYSRHDVPSVLTRLRVEFAGTDHPVEMAINEVRWNFCEIVARHITAGRANGTIPPGPPAKVTALAYMAAIDGVVNQLGDQAPFDALFAEKATLGVLGLPPASIT